MAENGIDYGMTPDGFIPKRLADIIEDMKSSIGSIKHPDTGELMFQSDSDDTILEQIIGVFSEGLSECWEAAYDGSVQFDPLKNSGAGQAGTVQINAILKKTGGYSLINMILGGVPGTVIPRGSRISSADGILVFATTSDATVGNSKTVLVTAQCETKGDINPDENTIIQIVDPITGWQGARNSDVVSIGTEEETEEELRRRQQRSTSLTSYRQIDAIYAAVLNVQGVIWCRAYQNDKYYPYDERGIPFKEVAVVADGGNTEEIANVLFYRFPVGVIGYGNTPTVLRDQQGIAYTISFSRPVDILIWIEIDLEVINQGEFPETYESDIITAILDYARYGGDGNQDGFPPGADIIRSRLYTPINMIGGHRILSVKLGVSEGNLGETDIPIPWQSVGRFASERIIVNQPLMNEDSD